MVVLEVVHQLHAGHRQPHSFAASIRAVLCAKAAQVMNGPYFGRTIDAGV